MRKGTLRVGRVDFPVHAVNTLIIGSGAAALNAAVRLHDFGQTDIAIVTDAWDGGTSFNSGSDKQTYYKLSLAGSEPDSPLKMAEDLFAGGCMHGDIALCEAQNSPRAFFDLVGLGVPFPFDEYGAYVGYKTDHDPRQRATSAGPLTSRLMFEALARDVRRRRIKVFDRHDVIALLTEGKGGGKAALGAVALDKKRLRPPELGFVLFNAVNVVLGTGGPGGMYRYSVYPESQTGSHGLAFAAGAVAQNLTESQFGLASLKFRWNLSGTYQQVLPRYFSTDREGGDEREFLTEVFPDMGRLATAVFLKGYQWPFDPRKVSDYGSSLIDLLVYRETVERGRRVFLDFRRNLSGGGRLEDFSFRLLSEEARTYLEKSDALLATPILRLKHMNHPAFDIYKSHGIDLGRTPLEIAVCAQHNNGGFRGNIWWESNIRRLFPVGEANGTHGVYRPGGSALNSGQVGGLRAALYIARKNRQAPRSDRAFQAAAGSRIQAYYEQALRMIDPASREAGLLQQIDGELKDRMSSHGAHIRRVEDIPQRVRAAWSLRRKAETQLRVPSARLLPEAFRVQDLCLAHAMYLEAIEEYHARGGKSRGSYLVLDRDGHLPCPGLEAAWKYADTPADAFVNRKILEVYIDDDGTVRKRWVPVRPVPCEDKWFENVWKDFMKDRIIRDDE